MNDSTEFTADERIRFGKALSQGWRVKSKHGEGAATGFILFKPDGHPQDVTQYERELGYEDAWRAMPESEVYFKVTPSELWPTHAWTVAISQRHKSEPPERYPLSPTVTRVLDADGNEIPFTFEIKEITVPESGIVSRRLTVTLSKAQDRPFTVYAVERYEDGGAE